MLSSIFFNIFNLSDKKTFLFQIDMICYVSDNKDNERIVNKQLIYKQYIICWKNNIFTLFILLFKVYK